jgi:hypothetical protein
LSFNVYIVFHIWLNLFHFEISVVYYCNCISLVIKTLYLFNCMIMYNFFVFSCSSFLNMNIFHTSMKLCVGVDFPYVAVPLKARATTVITAPLHMHILSLHTQIHILILTEAAKYPICFSIWNTRNVWCGFALIFRFATL